MNKVTPGQKHRSKARDLNQIAALLDRDKPKSGSIKPEDISRRDLITVRNDSGIDLDMFSAVIVTDLLIHPADNLNEFNHRTAYVVETPDEDSLGIFCVLQEPLANGAIGKAMMAGVTPCFISRPIGNTSDHAGTTNGERYLICGGTGALIVWEDNWIADEEHLAVVKIPHTQLTSEVQQFQIAVIDGDFLTCNSWDGSTAGSEDIDVARPALLRRSLAAWNGLTFTYASDQERTADDGVDTEDQKVTPDYVVGDIIYASNNVTGGTGVTDVDWIDLNCDARTWAKDI